MKKNLFVLSIGAMIFVISCKKNGNGTSNNPVNTSTSYAGSYSGNVTITANTIVNGITVVTPVGILNDHVITVANGSNQSNLILNTNLIQSGAATLSNNILTIERHTINSTVSAYTVEYGTGTFTNNTLSFDFHQDQFLTTTNALIIDGEWTGTLTKL